MRGKSFAKGKSFAIKVPRTGPEETAVRSREREAIQYTVPETARPMIQE